MQRSSKGKYDTGRIATLADIEAFEAIPLRDRNLPPTTYAMLRAGAALAPDDQ
jgi:fatty-acyl-CoA synthase